MGSLFTEILYRPLFNGVIALYNILPGNDFGFAIVALTILIRLALAPLSVRTLRSQQALARLAPQIQTIRERHKDNQSAQTAELMKLYREYKIHPLSGCLPFLIQLPILIALYQAFLAGFKPENLKLLYAFVYNPGTIQTTSFGFFDITAPSAFLAITAGALQFIHAKVTTQFQQPTGIAGQASRQLLYFFPLLIVIISWNLPAGLALYWVAATLFSLGEQLFLFRGKPST